MCDGRFSRVYQYHLRLLFHFTDKKPINLAFFLLKSMDMMETKVKLQKHNHISSIFHFFPIKILVKFGVDKKNIYWFKFLSRIGILPQTKSSSVKNCEEEQEVHETNEKFAHIVKETNFVEGKDEKSNNMSVGKLGKRGKKQISKGKEEMGERKVQVESSKTTKFQVKVEEIVKNEEFVMRPRTRSRANKSVEGVISQTVVEIWEDKQEEEQEDKKRKKLEKYESIQFEQE